MSVSGKYMAANKQTRTCIMKLFFSLQKQKHQKSISRINPKILSHLTKHCHSIRIDQKKSTVCLTLYIPTIFQQSSLTYHTATVLNYFFISSQTNRSSRIQILGHGFKIKMDTVGKQIGVKTLKVIQDLI